LQTIVMKIQTKSILFQFDPNFSCYQTSALLPNTIKSDKNMESEKYRKSLV
jgi:hypothetical protein